MNELHVPSAPLTDLIPDVHGRHLENGSHTISVTEQKGREKELGSLEATMAALDCQLPDHFM